MAKSNIDLPALPYLCLHPREVIAQDSYGWYCEQCPVTWRTPAERRRMEAWLKRQARRWFSGYEHLSTATAPTSGRRSKQYAVDVFLPSKKSFLSKKPKRKKGKG